MTYFSGSIIQVRLLIIIGVIFLSIVLCFAAWLFTRPSSLDINSAGNTESKTKNSKIELGAEKSTILRLIEELENALNSGNQKKLDKKRRILIAFGEISVPKIEEVLPQKSDAARGELYKILGRIPCKNSVEVMGNHFPIEIEANRAIILSQVARIPGETAFRKLVSFLQQEQSETLLGQIEKAILIQGNNYTVSILREEKKNFENPSSLEELIRRIETQGQEQHWLGFLISLDLNSPNIIDSLTDMVTAGNSLALNQEIIDKCKSLNSTGSNILIADILNICAEGQRRFLWKQGVKHLVISSNACDALLAIGITQNTILKERLLMVLESHGRKDHLEFLQSWLSVENEELIKTKITKQMIVIGK